MAEVIALSSSIVSFIALAGQVLHGCRFVVEFLDDVVDASDDLAYLVAEVEGFRSAILAFQRVLQQVHPAMNIQPVEEQIKSALYLSSSTIDDLNGFITKHKGEKRWKALTLARRKAKLVKYLDRLGRAKADISLAQASTSLILTIAHQWKIERLSQSMSALNAQITPQKVMPADEISVSKQRIDFNTKDREMDVSHPMYQKNQQEFHPTSDTPQIGSWQILFTQTYYLWLATISISSIFTTTQEPLASTSDKMDDKSYERATTQTSVDIRLHPWITKYCLLAIFEQPYLRFTPLDANLRLRVYHYVSWDAPIAKACRKGDVTAAAKLFKEGRASPHDIVVRKTPPGGLTSLTDLAWEYWLDLGVRLNNSEESDDRIEPFLQKLRNLFEVYRFLVDNGHNSSKYIRWDKMTVCQLWILYHKEWSKHPALIPHIGDMTQLVMKKVDTRLPPSFKVCRDLSTSPYDSFMVPSLSSQRNSVAWIMRDGQSVPMMEAPIKLPYLYIIHAYTSGTASLMLDPEATCLHQSLQYVSPEVRDKVLVGSCILAECQSQRLFEDGKGSWESAVKMRLVSCLKCGMDPMTTRGIAYGFSRSSGSTIQSYDSAGGSSESLIQYFISAGKAEILRSAMLHVGRDPDEVATLFEEEACASIVQELNQLKPAFHLSEVQRNRRHNWGPECPDSAERCCRYYVGLALNEGYRRYFPEEGEKTMELIKEIELENQESPEEEIPPAINGLAEDFWD